MTWTITLSLTAAGLWLLWHLATDADGPVQAEAEEWVTPESLREQ